LKPALYHKHKADLLLTPRDELPDVVDDLVEEARDLSRAFNSLSVEPSDGSESPVEGIWTTSIYVAPNLRLDLGEPIQNPTTITRSEDKTLKVTVRVVEVYKPLKDTPCVLPVDVAKTTPVFMFALPSPRSHGKDFIIALGSLVTKLRALASQSITLQVLLSPGREEELTTAVDIYKKGVSSNSGERQTSLRNSLPSSSSLTGPELQAARKAIIPVAIALLSAIPGLEDRVDEGELDVDKAVIADYLHTLVALWPDGNVQRAALKRLNEFLMSSDYR
jgi:tRNA A64-2'-O-ribosylphosphate transferase